MEEIRPTTIRRLPAEEWGRLEGLPIASKGLPDPERVVIIAAETDEGEIVGTWSLVFAPFLEGYWVKEPYRRRTSVAYRILMAMKKFLKGFGVDHAMTIVSDPYVLQLAERTGFELFDGTCCKITSEHF